MTRAQKVGGLAAVFTLLYVLAATAILPVPLISQSTADLLLPVIPWWLLVSFGSYSLGTLGWGLFTFRDCPEAYQELMLEITLAKDELRTRGVTVD